MKNKILSLKSIEKYLLNIFDKKPKDELIRIGQYCITQGWVERIAGIDLKLCDNPECGSCSFIIKELTKQLKQNDTKQNNSRFNRPKRK